MQYVQCWGREGSGSTRLARVMYAGIYSCRMCFVTVSVDATLSYFSSLLPVAKARYQKLLVGLCACPYELPQLAWVDDVTQWPRVEFSDIVLYLIDTPGEFTREKLKTYKSLEAYNYYVSRWVGTYHIHIVSEEFCLLEAEIRPSQRVNSASHQPWVAVRRRDGCTSAAHCTCMTG